MSPLPAAPLTIEWSLLGLLAEQPMHGYELHQRLAEAAGLGLVWRIKQSQLYALLARLEKRGYLVSTLEPQEAHPPRKVYALTPAGEAALAAWVQTPVRHGRDFRLEFLAKVYFAQRRGEDVLLALLHAQKAACQSWLENLQATAGAHPPASYEELVRRFRLGQIQAMLQWLDESIAVIK